MLEKNKLHLWFSLLFIANFTYGQNTLESFESSCEFAVENNLVQNRTLMLQCCNSTVRSFYREWFTGRRSLSKFMTNLKQWQCPQFKEECERQTFDYTDFTKMVYLKFCQPIELEKRCFRDLQEVAQTQAVPAAPSKWNFLVQNINYTKLDHYQLLHPCVQVAMLDSAQSKGEHFHEVVEAFVPFCSFIWCGFDQNVLSSKDISVWTCMVPQCRKNIIVIAVVCALLALVTTASNATVLVVLFTNKKLMNSQTIYKISLAFADLLVGIVVFPTFISTLTKSLIGRHELGFLHNISDYPYPSLGNESRGSNLSFIEIREPSGLLSDRIPQSYYSAVGFFTTLSLTVSVYTLVAAAIDRFVAIHQPLKYQQFCPVSVARKASLLIWGIATLFSSLPLFVEDLTYRRITLILVSSAGHAALILYLLALLLPLVVIWTVTIATLCSFKTHSKLRKTLNSNRGSKKGKKKASLEVRLATTLGIMVGVFTLCVFPVGIVLATSLFTPNISVFNPKNLNQSLTIQFLSAEVVVTIILTTNSLWNFFIYSGRDTKFRAATKNRYKNLLHTLNVYRSGSKADDTVFT